MKVEFFPAFDYYVLQMWRDNYGLNLRPVEAYDDLKSALERAQKERSRYQGVYTVTVVWLKNALHFLPFIGHDGDEWKWINADGLTTDQLRAVAITAITMTSAAFAEHAEVGHNRYSRGLNLADGRVYISPFRLEPLVFPDGVGADLVKLTS